MVMPFSNEILTSVLDFVEVAVGSAGGAGGAEGAGFEGGDDGSCGAFS